MYSIIKNITGYFSSSSEPLIEPLEKAFHLIKQRDEDDPSPEIEKESEATDNQCFKRIAKIIYIDNHCVTLEGELYFDNCSLSGLQIGDNVVYLGYMKDGVLKVSKILEKLDEWEQPQEENNLWIQRKLVGKVKERNGRNVIIEPGNLVCDLNTVKSEFVPVVGDWLDVEAITQVDEKVTDLCGEVLDITRISPLRANMVQGVVNKWSDELEIGIINSDIFFDKDSCVPGYVPMLKDQVSVEMIESDQHKCSWRALHVYPEEKTTLKERQNTTDSSTVYLLQNKNGIEINGDSKISFKKIGETENFVIQVRNTSNKSQNVTGCYFKNSNWDKSQVQLVSPELDDCITIEPEASVSFNYTCTAKSMGTTNELLVFKFDNFEIGRFIIIQVLTESAQLTSAVIAKSHKQVVKNARFSMLNDNSNTLLGQKPVRPPSFITNKLEMYDIPQRLTENLFNEMNRYDYLGEIPIEKVAPVLALKLDIRNYGDRFHNLVHLEELALQINMHKYDMERASFVRNDEFLMLEVADLSERRPSVILGDKVIAYNPYDTKVKYEGFVHRTSARHVYLKFHQTFHDVYDGRDYTVEFRSSRTNFRRYHQAVDLAVRQLGKDFLFPTHVKLKPAQIHFDIDDDSQTTKANNYVKSVRGIMKKSPSSRVKEGGPVMPSVTLRWFDNSLNMYQRRAVENILRGEARPLPYLIFGPPGTGKTVTLIETILQIIKHVAHSRVLVVAPSNSAADLLALRLLDSGVLEPGDLVRMVAFRCINEGTIPERLVPYCVTGDISREGSRESKAAERLGVRVGMQASVLGRHRITVGTCMVVGNLYTMGFARGHFTHVIVDEAGQATEPELLIPLCLLDVRTAQCVFAGDPLQLGPCVFSRLSEAHGLSESLFERLLYRFPYARDTQGFPDTGGYDARLVTRLVYNYRSLPEILALPNRLFYDNELRATISATEPGGEERELLLRVANLLPERPPDLGAPHPPAVVFHGVRGQNMKTPDSPSWFNLTEAAQVFYYVNDLYNAGLTQSDIGVITPYIKQGQQVRALFQDAELDVPKVGSVEEFQGQEFKVIVLTTVRSNEGAEGDPSNTSRYALGFMASPRRLNVAVTRARALLIVVGNPHLLCTDNYWRSVLAYAVRIGGYRGCDLPAIFTST